MLGLALFDTDLGRCGIAWGDRGVLAVQLPEQDDAAILARLLRHAPGARGTEPPVAVRAAMEAVATLLSGEARDLREIELDMSGVQPFHRRVYEVVRAIRPGETRTYGQVAALAGEPGAAQAVGQAMRRNPFAPVVPCHRVVAAGRRLGGFSASGGLGLKRRMLATEGARGGDAPDLFDTPPPAGA